MISTLRKRTSFLSVKQAGHSWVTPAFVVQFLPVSPENREGVCVGYTATKKTFRRAVDRNRVKRRLREALRLSFPQLSLPQGSAIVLIARSHMLDVSFETLQKDLKWACRKLIEKTAAEGEAERA